MRSRPCFHGCLIAAAWSSRASAWSSTAGTGWAATTEGEPRRGGSLGARRAGALATCRAGALGTRRAGALRAASVARGQDAIDLADRLLAAFEPHRMPAQLARGDAVVLEVV